jgi:predicted dehydrogenase
MIKLNFGVVGFGYWGPNLVRNLTNNPYCDKIKVCDVKSKQLKLVKERYPMEKVSVTKSYDELLQDKQINAIIVATPISTHFDLARSALEHGKHVFVEKPLCHTADMAKTLVDLAKTKNLTLMVGHTFIFSPPVIKIRDLIKEKALGKIYFVNVQRVNLGLHQRDVSVLWDLGPHDISIFLYWFGEVPLQVSAFGRDCVQKGIPDVCFLNMQFPSGAIVNLAMSWLSPSKLRQTIIVGEKKMLVYDDTEVQEKVKIYDKGVNYRDPETFGEYHLSYRSGDILSPHLESFEPLNLELTNFCECIMNGKTPKSDGEMGWQVVKILEAAEQSIENGGCPMKISW